MFRLKPLEKKEALTRVSQPPFRKLKIEVIWFHLLGKELYANYRIAQLIALSKLGHEVTYVTVQAARSQLSMSSVPGFKLRALQLRRFTPGISIVVFQLFALRHLLRSLPDCDAVILHPDSFPLIFPILLLHRLVNRSPALFLRISTNPIERNGSLYDLTQNFIYILSLKISALFFDKLFFISPMLGESSVLRFGIPRSKVAVWPVAVDTHLFQERDKNRVNELRGELGLSGRLGVLYHGVISGGRGILETVEAFKILKNESVKATLILLGNGPARKEIEQYVLDNHLEEIVKIRGPVEYSEVADYVAACDVGIIPLPDRSWWWFQPSLKLLEYLALRKPVIVSDIPSNRAVVDDLSIGFYLKGTRPVDIAQGIRDFLGSRKDFDQATAVRIAESFSVENVAKGLEQQILSVVN